MTFLRQLLFIGIATVASMATTSKAAQSASAIDGYDLFPAQVSENGFVTAQERVAAEVGRDILAAGGNAVDAAVATGFALAVTHPQAGNLGGGGFMMVYLAEENRAVAIDFREMAPAGATRDMYLDQNGDADFATSQFSHLSAGVPGSVMGLVYALETYGTMSLREVIAPAILLAARGFEVTYAYEASLAEYRSGLLIDQSSVEYFLEGLDGEAYRVGDIVVQKDLARTLRDISREGAKGFYEGRVAELIVAEMERGGGLITLDDLATYRVIEREPVYGIYRGYEIVAMPPPSSGGIHIIQMLNILEGYEDLTALGHNSADYIHRLVEAMRRAYADRSQYLGDPDYYAVPTAALTDKAYAEELRSTINLRRANKSLDIRPGLDLPAESPQTTHYSVMDAEGNTVAVATTLNFSFGSGYSVDGAGFLLNNEMDDFSAKPGAPNGYGLIGGTANAIEAGKRPLSSMSPTIVLKGGKPFLVTGSRGGSTIITTVLQVILNVIEFDMNVEEASRAPRIHHQWLPDVVVLEPGVSNDTQAILRDRGFDIRVLGDDLQLGFLQGRIGRTQTIMYDDGYYYSSSDPRGSRGYSATY